MAGSAGPGRGRGRGSEACNVQHGWVGALLGACQGRLAALHITSFMANMYGRPPPRSDRPLYTFISSVMLVSPVIVEGFI